MYFTAHLTQTSKLKNGLFLCSSGMQYFKKRDPGKNDFRLKGSPAGHSQHVSCKEWSNGSTVASKAMPACASPPRRKSLEKQGGLLCQLQGSRTEPLALHNSLFDGLLPVGELVVAALHHWREIYLPF